MKKDFWHKSTVVVIGGGSWGTVLANLAAKNVSSVGMWMRSEEKARSVNATRTNADYQEALLLDSKIKAYSEIERVFALQPKVVIWALPSSACRDQARAFAKHFQGDEIILHATKGIEAGTLKRISTVLEEEIPCPRIGVISGPNLAKEIAKGKPAATVVASRYQEVIEAGCEVLQAPAFRVFGADDIIGVEWAGTLKNMLAIAAGLLDTLNLGWNTRAMLISNGLAEMVRFAGVMGAQTETFLGLAGVGDVLATCTSPLSRNYRVGVGLAEGRSLDKILEKLGSTAEGVKTIQEVYEYSRKRGLHLSITEGVYRVLFENLPPEQMVEQLMQSEGLS
jgi:glycerol-3-phosphate dehydrogenase (NAD(P)+)